jgi:hypothetical protein
MAKELPYYKFEPNQWENGNIQICTREDKGLFVDLCSMYWSRLGDVPLKLAIQKLCGGNALAFDSLIDEGIFEVIDDMICIHFLNEQLGEFDNTSKQNSKNAKLRWEKVRKQKDTSGRNASASIPQCETDTIREDKSIEDKITTIYEKFVDEIKSGAFQTRIESLYMRLRIKEGSLTPLLKDFKLHIIEENRTHKDTSEFFGNFKNWLNVQDRNKLLDKYKKN